ncbi:MAG TPA: oligosaccharide flippase family protein [Miltoncostaeaceae bacterium]|nr:oligosaccharide flippase family protein [Miltoncostaeaceae bacterium]
MGRSVPVAARLRPAHARVRAHLAVPLNRNGYFLVLAYAASSALGLLFWVVAARSVDAATVGVAAALFSLVMLVSGLSQLSLNNVLMRFVPVAGRRARRLVALSYAAAAGSTLLISTAVAATAPMWSDDLAFLGRDPLWAMSFVLATAAWSVFVLQDGALAGARAAKWVAVEAVAFSVARIALLVPLAVAGVAGVFAAAVVPAVVALVPVNLLLFARLLTAGGTPDGILRRRDVSRFAASNYAGSLFAAVSTFALPLVVAASESPRDVAYFYAAWNVAIGLQLVAASMMSSLVVEAARSPDALADHARTALRGAMRLVAPAAVALVALAPWVLAVFGGDYADEAAWSLRILALSALPNVVIALAVGAARVLQRLRLLVGLQAATCLLGVGASALLARRYGITGASIGWAAGQTIMGAVAGAWLLRLRGAGSTAA